MFFNGYKLGDIVEINGKDKGIIIHAYVFGSYFLIELLHNEKENEKVVKIHILFTCFLRWIFIICYFSWELFIKQWSIEY